MIVAIIPARGKSKRIPRKNIRSFAGNPIIAYSIRAAIDCKCFDRIIVSTDDKEIASISSKFGAEVPFFRPNHLSTDHATILEVISHTAKTLQLSDDDLLCSIFATAPLISTDDILSGLELINKFQLDYTFSATEFSFPIQRAFTLNQHSLVEMIQPEYFNVRSQDLKKSFHDAGQFYWGRVAAFRQKLPFFHNSRSMPVILPHFRVQDIDTFDDWKRAELLFNLLNEKDI